VADLTRSGKRPLSSPSSAYSWPPETNTHRDRHQSQRNPESRPGRHLHDSTSASWKHFRSQVCRATSDFDPGVTEKWGGAVPDHHLSRNTVLLHEPRGDDRALQTADGLPVTSAVQRARDHILGGLDWVNCRSGPPRRLVRARNGLRSRLYLDPGGQAGLRRTCGVQVLRLGKSESCKSVVA
jgi:hypothetical protein